MPESLVAESWLVCRSDSQRKEAQSCGAPDASRPPRGNVAAPSCPSKRTVFFLLSVNRLLSEESSHK
ncbi:jg2895 [Pararge aegeria aegeria]|uniref:Jg2895 protein n=1 Tax=Pararge aegeria aegeria TaxID=348720 RepID=A0A8S4SNG4_9NEOP|nr:jg2895 [Pararge aegeria aegeria]